MGRLSFLRPAFSGLLALAAGAASTATAADSDELGPAAASARGVVIHGAAETLRDYCRQEDGALWLELPGGARFELITSTADSGISNPGDGSFHPFDESEVRDALEGLRFPLEGLSAEIFLLPYPRRAGLTSAAGPALVLLSPGVLPLPAAYQHCQLTHELGHVVQYALMPDADTTGWTRYRRLRGITDESVYNAGAVHADRPHEIFAEDFRALFGDPLANESGSIENASLPMPQQVAGLPAFMANLGEPAGGTLAAFPNPARGPVTFRCGGAAERAVDLFDLQGRRIATLSPQPSSAGVRWTWDGRNEEGLEVRGTVVLARARGERGPALRLVRAP